MMRSIVIDRAADADIDEYFVWIGEQDFAAAVHFLDAAQKTIARLAESPELGRQCEFANPEFADVRRWAIEGFPNHLVFYRVTDERLRVVRVLHGARDIQSIFESK